jgi:alkylhydroperoxidase family enzyme
LVADDEARGPLAEIFAAARARAGRVWNIVRLMSRRPRQCAASLELYREAMFGPSPLSRAEREMLATVVSSLNRCRY